MQSRGPVTLNLSSLLQHAPGAPLDVRGEGLFEPPAELLEADGLRLAGPIKWRLSVINAGGDDDFVVEGAAEATAVMECRRCLVDVETKLSTTFVYPMEYRPSDLPLYLDEEGDEGDDGLLVFGSPVVDFSAFLAELLAIELPITVLCRPDCLGLNENGVNLNEHPELAQARDSRASDDEPSPFAALKNLDIRA